MIDPKKISTLGIGFGAVAVAAIGLIASTPVNPPIEEQLYRGGAGGGNFIWQRYQSHNNRSLTIKLEKHKDNVIDNNEQNDEEESVVLVLVDLFYRGII